MVIERMRPWHEDAGGWEVTVDYRYWHGGAPDLRPGDIIEPRTAMDHRHLVDGCAICEARRQGETHPDDDNDPGMIYVTTSRDYARIYAAGYPFGALYRVDPIGVLVGRGEHDPAPSWGCTAARVLSVYDPVVVYHLVGIVAESLGVAS